MSWLSTIMGEMIKLSTAKIYIKFIPCKQNCKKK